jgi:hypothetical protein
MGKDRVNRTTKRRCCSRDTAYVSLFKSYRRINFGRRGVIFKNKFGNNIFTTYIRRNLKTMYTYLRPATVKKDGYKGFLYIHRWETGYEFLIYTNKLP